MSWVLLLSFICTSCCHEGEKKNSFLGELWNGLDSFEEKQHWIGGHLWREGVRLSDPRAPGWPSLDLVSSGKPPSPQQRVQLDLQSTCLLSCPLFTIHYVSFQFLHLSPTRTGNQNALKTTKRPLFSHMYMKCWIYILCVHSLRLWYIIPFYKHRYSLVEEIKFDWNI